MYKVILHYFPVQNCLFLDSMTVYTHAWGGEGSVFSLSGSWRELSSAFS